MTKIKAWMKRAFTDKIIVGISAFALIFKSIPFIWIVWDSLLSIRVYKRQHMKEHLLRVFRLIVGLSWFAGIINPLTAGAFFVTDGLFSIFRYRFKNVTNHFIEDVPRFIRILVGLSIVYAFPIIPLF